MNELNSEIVDLASDGFFYPTGSAMSSGHVEMYPMTAADEELLCSGNLLKRGLALPRLLSRILPPAIDIDTILQCDLETILLNARIMNYGSNGAIRCTCSDCEESFDADVSFGFRAIPFAFDGLQRGRNTLVFMLPKSKKSLLFRLPTWREYQSWKPLGWIEFAKRITLMVEGEENIDQFYERTMSGTDSKAFRDFYEKRTPGFITRWTSACPKCGNSTIINVGVTTDIFGIRPESKSIIHDEIFSLCYHSNGAFTQEVVYRMPVSLRRFYIKKLIDLKNDENNKTKRQEETVKAMSRTSPNSIQSKSLPTSGKH